MLHKFHIPVLGLGFSIDTPVKVAKYGISSVVSIVDDELTERMRAYYCDKLGERYIAIPKNEADSRPRRITSYLNLLARTVNRDFNALRNMPFRSGNDLCKYFELLPDDSPLKHGYELMMEYPDGPQKEIFQNILKRQMRKGAIDVNIMSKVDRLNPAAKSEGELHENSEALAALRGFAHSKLSSSVILSAGMNPRLYSYVANFPDFLPDQHFILKKKIILKVSDFRSAFIQAKFLAKKGLWVSEFRIESGLNCGGHAFATDGFLLGPILEEFKAKRQDMKIELHQLYKEALSSRGIYLQAIYEQRLSVQGGIGTAAENDFLIKHYSLDATGWGSPFLLVPEVTNVDSNTRHLLKDAKEEDFYLSGSSPLGIPFNNFRHSSMEQERLKRIEQGRPGSPCTKKYLVSNTEFTKEPICTASRKYQNYKIKELQKKTLTPEAYKSEFDRITEKICLCEGLCSSAYQHIGILKPKESKSAAICPGPNLAYFSGEYSLGDMVGHIYGRNNLLQQVIRPHVFLKELDLYIQYLQQEIANYMQGLGEKKETQLLAFKKQLSEGIAYYKQLFKERGQSFRNWGQPLQKLQEALQLAERKLALTAI